MGTVFLGDIGHRENILFGHGRSCLAIVGGGLQRLVGNNRIPMRPAGNRKIKSVREVGLVTRLMPPLTLYGAETNYSHSIVAGGLLLMS